MSVNSNEQTGAAEKECYEEKTKRWLQTRVGVTMTIRYVRVTGGRGLQKAARHTSPIKKDIVIPIHSIHNSQEKGSQRTLKTERCSQEQLDHRVSQLWFHITLHRQK